jgi:predicted lipase
MYTISKDIINKSFLVVSDAVVGPWKYVIDHKLSHEYSDENAQVLLEYSYNVSVTNRNNITPLNPPHFDIVIPLYTTVFFEKVNVAWIFYSTSLNILVIVFTATYNDLLVLIDIDYKQTVPTTLHNKVKGIKVHGGFWKLYSHIRKELYDVINKYVGKDNQTIVTGLSLGGALSTLCMLDMYEKDKDMIHYSFASPRVFDIIGAEYYDSLMMNSYRIVNNSDIIPMTPLPIMSDIVAYEYYQHVNTLASFDNNQKDYYDNHIYAYLSHYKL